MSIESKRVWCFIRGHRFHKEYDEERTPHLVCLRCGEVKDPNSISRGAAGIIDIGGGA